MWVQFLPVRSQVTWVWLGSHWNPSATSKRVFPKTAGAIKELVGIIDELMPERQAILIYPRLEDRTIQVVDVVRLKNALHSLMIFLRDEADRSYVVLCVEDQRFLSAYSLMEKIETLFRPRILENNRPTGEARVSRVWKMPRLGTIYKLSGLPP